MSAKLKAEALKFSIHSQINTWLKSMTMLRVVRLTNMDGFKFCVCDF